MSIIESIKNESTIALNKILTARNDYINNKNIVPIKKQIQQYEKYRIKMGLLNNLLPLLKIHDPIFINDNTIKIEECCLNFDIIKKHNVVEYDKEISIMGLSGNLNLWDYILGHWGTREKFSKYEIYDRIPRQITDEIAYDTKKGGRSKVNIASHIINKKISSHIIAWNTIEIKNAMNRFIESNEYYKEKELGLFEILTNYAGLQIYDCSNLDDSCLPYIEYVDEDDCIENNNTQYDNIGIIAIFCKLVEIKNIILEEIEAILNAFMLEFNIEEIKQKKTTEICVLISSKIKVIDLIIQGLYVDLYELN